MTGRGVSLLGLLLGKIANLPAVSLLLCIAGLVFLSVAAFTWNLTAGFASIGGGLLLLEVRVSASTTAAAP